MRLGRTDLSRVIRLVTSDAPPLTRHARGLIGGAACVGQGVSVCVFAGSEIIPESSCASAYGASAPAATVLI